MMAEVLKNPKKLIEEICEDQRVMNRRNWYLVTLTAILFILLVGYLYLSVFWLTPSWIIEKPIPFYYQKWFHYVYSSTAIIYLIIYLFVGYRMYREDRKKMEKYKKYEILIDQEKGNEK